MKTQFKLKTNMMRWGVKNLKQYDKVVKRPSKSRETVPLSIPDRQHWMWVD
jgi:hypothetical protein